MEDDEECNTGLRLALGLGNYVSEDERQKKEKKSVVCLDLSFTLYPKEKTVNLDRNTNYKVEEGSSFKAVDDQEDEEHGKKKRRSSGDSKSCENDCGSRKKLRLTKEQSSLLEHSFKLHSTLNPAQKQALAERLNLKPRQVEVWFQNRRARTKLKQTEVDCELLKKCCESLSDENRRLKKELQELRYLKLIGRSPPPPLYLHLPNSRVPTSSTTLTLCPSCEKTPSGSCEEEQEENVSICKSNNNKLQGGLGGTPTN